MSNEPYCVWCNQIGHEPTSECQRRSAARTCPDRQRGDGLRAKLIAFDNFLNEPPPYEDKTMVRDYRHSAYAKWSSLSRDISALINRAPARDAAEGARDLFAEVTKIDLGDAVKHLRNWASYIDQHHRQKYADLIEAQAKLIAWFVNTAAPQPEDARDDLRPDAEHPSNYRKAFAKAATPKPAPDAVREAQGDVVTREYLLEALRDQRIQLGGMHDKTLTELKRVRQDAGEYMRKQEDEIKQLRAALSAPVPSPDGALTPLDRPTRPGEKRTFGPSEPPATGAAEPVAIGEQQIFDEAKRRYEGHGRFQRVFIEGAAWGIHHRATAPVRGDREAIAWEIRRVVGTDLSPAQCSNLADAILSLPVQPGAGDRDQFVDIVIKRMNNLIETYDEESAWENEAAAEMRKAVRILSRQPPQSNSEGGPQTPQGNADV